MAYYATQIDYDLAKAANPGADVRLYVPGQTQMGAGDYYLGGTATGVSDAMLGGAQRISGADRYATQQAFVSHAGGAAPKAHSDPALEAWAAATYGDTVHPTTGYRDGRDVVYGTAAQIAEAQNFLAPDRYRFVEVPAGQVAPATGGILLGNTKGDSSTNAWARLGGPESGKSVGLAAWEWNVSTGAQSPYVTGAVPYEHTVAGGGYLPVGYSANYSGGFLTPEQWLEQKRAELGPGGLAAPGGGTAVKGRTAAQTGGAPAGFEGWFNLARNTMRPVVEQDLQNVLHSLAARAEQRGTWTSGMQNVAEQKVASDANIALQRAAFDQAMAMAGYDQQERNMLWNQYMGEQQFGLQQFQAYAPYTMPTWAEAQGLPLSWAQTMGTMPGSGAMRAVTGGAITQGPGGATMTLNGRQIDEALAVAMGGYYANGVFYLPDQAARAYLGGV